ncbi:MAG: hypothetical protein ACLQF1_08990 [Methyloceanibacter sp.]|jgi:hypothetical protein
MKSVVAIIVALGLTIAFTSPTLASGKTGELYNAAASKADCENLPNGKWDDKTKTCSKGK